MLAISVLMSQILLFLAKVNDSLLFVVEDACYVSGNVWKEKL